MRCHTCEQYDAMGYGNACPCVHVNGKCTTPTTKPALARNKLLRDAVLGTNMKTIYAIRDRVAQELVGLSMYMLFVFRTDQQAVRYFADAINDTTSILNKHPSDYELVALGILDRNGDADEFIRAGVPTQVIITGDALVAAQEPKLVKES